MRLGVGLSICDQRPASTVVASAPTDIDQLLLDGTNAAHYTTAQWPGFEHLLADRKYTVGTLRTPRAGRCWLFDGTDDYGTVSRITSGTITSLTVTAWVNPTAFPNTNNTIASEWTSTGSNGSWIIWFNTSGEINFYNSPNGSSFPNTNTAITVSTGVWTHVGITYNAGTLKVYKDGVEVYSGAVSSSSLYNSVAPFQVGRFDGTGHFRGKMRDVRVYSSVKSASEILAIKNQADTPGTYDTTGLLAGYWCEEESGTTGYDWSGNGRNLTLTNITQSTFHASDTGVTYSDANVRGARQSKTIIYTSGGSSWADGVTFLSGIALTGSLEIEVGGFAVSGGAVPVCGMQSESTKTATNNYSNIDCGVQYNNSTTLRVWVNGTSSDHTVSSYDSTAIAKIVRSGTTASIYLNGVLVTTKTVSSGTMYAVSTFQAGGSSQTIRMLYNSGINMEQDNAGVGSNLTSGMFIMPAVSSTLAADGNALTVTGKCPQPGYAPQKVVTGDGSSVYVDLGSPLIPASSDFSLEFAYYPTGTLSNKGPLTQGNNAGIASRFGLYHLDESTISLLVDHVSGVGTGAVSIAITKDAWSTIRVTKSGSSYTLSVNGTSSSITNTGTITQSTNTQILRYSGCVSGRVSNLKVTTGGTTTYFPLCEGPGSSNTNRDVYYLKSDNTSGVVSSAIVNGTVSTIWSNATDYTSGVFNWPLRYGYTVNGSGVIVPAKLNGASDAAGNAIGQAAGGWASGLQNLNCLPYTNPLGVSVGLETSLDPTADRKTTSSSKRRRRNTSGRYDRFGARSTAMSDASSNAYFGD